MKLGVPSCRNAHWAWPSTAASWSAVGSGAPHRFRRTVALTEVLWPVESGVAALSGLCHRTPKRCRAHRRPGSLAPAVQMANTRSLFRGEGWGEGTNLPPTRGLPNRHRLVPVAALPSPRSGRFPRTIYLNRPGNLAKGIEVVAELFAPNTPGLRPSRLRHSDFVIPPPS